MGTYEYDLWGRLISATEGEPGVDTDNILTKNPFRHRSYYYDNETGLYNLNARYYDPEIRRFISADSMSVLMVATVSLECKNLFAYSENNPITGKDSSGGIIESAFDIVTLAGSIVDVCCHPTDPWAWAGLVGDAVDLIPVVTGVGEGIKGLRVAAKAAEVADNAHDAGKAAEAAAGTVQVVSKSTNVTAVTKQTGWKVGDPIDNLTKDGNEPAWSTVKSRYWKNEAYFNPEGYSLSNLALMNKGKAPRYDDIINVPKELHHINGRNIENPHNIRNLMQVWPWEHADIDPYRHYTGPRP